MGSSFKTTLAFLAAAGLVSVTQAEVPTIAGYKLTWSDDFVGTANSLPKTADWTAMTGTSYPGGAQNWGTWEIETYTSSTENLALTGDGKVGITARRDAAGAWTSARIETVRQDFQCAAGKKMRIQGSASLPALGANGIGYWPAFWALGSNFRDNYTYWPQSGELDILENVNALNKVWGTLHCGVNPGGPCQETDGLSGNMLPNGSAIQGNFHTYTIEVDRTDANNEAVRWFFDDNLFWQVTQSSMDATTWSQTVHNSYFVILNLAIGGSFPDKVYGSKTPIESTASSGTFLIDYVAVYNSI